MYPIDDSEAEEIKSEARHLRRYQHLLSNCTPIAVTLTTQPVNSARRMMMTIKQTLQATLVGLILSVPFLIEIAKELVK
jgi:ABC-type phosphate/phosphonate transport system permease subunit